MRGPRVAPGLEADDPPLQPVAADGNGDAQRGGDDESGALRRRIGAATGRPVLAPLAGSPAASRRHTVGPGDENNEHREAGLASEASAATSPTPGPSTVQSSRAARGSACLRTPELPPLERPGQGRGAAVGDDELHEVLPPASMGPGAGEHGEPGAGLLPGQPSWQSPQQQGGSSSSRSAATPGGGPAPEGKARDGSDDEPAEPAQDEGSALADPVEPEHAAKSRWGALRHSRHATAALGQIMSDAQLYGLSRGGTTLTTNQLAAMAGPEQRRVAQKLCVFLPSSPRKQAWDVLVVALILYTALVAPFRVGFGVEASGGLVYVEAAMDVMFMLDVLLNFVSAFEEDNVVVVDHRRIAAHYLRTWFALDLVASIPFTLLDPNMGIYNRQLRLLRTWKLFRLMRLARLFRVARLSRVSSSLVRVVRLVRLNPGFLRIAKLAVSFLVFSHWCACAWFYVALAEDLAPHTWVGRYEWEGETVATHYIISLYWTWSTLTTLGYGDITAGTNAERICTMFCMLLGVSFYSFITASMSSFLERMDAASQRRRDQQEELEQYLNARKLSKALKARIRDYFYSRWEQQRASWSEDVLLDRMSADLQCEVVHEIHRHVIPKFPLLRDQDPHFAAQIVRRFAPVRHATGRVMAREGARCDHLAFIHRGHVEAFGAGSGARFLSLPQGSFFGEIALLLTDKFVASYRAMGDCQLFLVSRDAAADVLRQFPAAEEELRQAALARLRQIKVVQDRLERRYLGAAGRLVWRRAATAVAREGDAQRHGSGLAGSGLGGSSLAAAAMRHRAAGGASEAADHGGSTHGAWGKPLMGFLVEAARDAEAQDQTVRQLDPDTLQESAVAMVAPDPDSARCVSGSNSNGGSGGGSDIPEASTVDLARGQRGGGGGEARKDRRASVPPAGARNLEDMDMRSPLLVSDMMLKLNFLVEHVHGLEARMQELGERVAAPSERALRHTAS